MLKAGKKYRARTVPDALAGWKKHVKKSGKEYRDDGEIAGIQKCCYERDIAGQVYTCMKDGEWIYDLGIGCCIHESMLSEVICEL